MSQYKTGTATVTNGSATVTGSGTLWSANVSAADSFTIAGDGVMYDVASVDSDTQVTLSVPYAGTTASGVVYAIGTGFTVPDSFPEMSQGDIETATIFTRAMRKIQGKFSGIVSGISGKADISGQVFTGDIAAPKITASTGILFGTDTAAANTLDDYEEGTWTPVVENSSGFDDTTMTGIVAKYTKIGRQVTLEFKFNFQSSTGNLAVGDDIVLTAASIPFTPSATARPVGIGGSQASMGSGEDIAQALIGFSNSASLGIVFMAVDGTVPTSQTIGGVATYFTDS